MNASFQLQTGQIFARYQIVRILGEGGMGTVYEAFHPALKKRFAIKTLLTAIAEVPEYRARFLREAEVAARINHPNIVRVTDVGSDGDIPYMVMEYLEGQTLGRLLETRGHLEITETADIVLPVISAVAAGHAEGVVHRDLKPENIFLTQGPWGEIVPKVLDFGVSKLMTEDSSGALTGTLTVLGTAAYMSPEQARGARQVDHLSDQYALGLIVYEMVTGTRGHPGENAFEILYNISNLAIVPLRETRPDCPPDLEKVVMQTLASDPEKRFRSLLELGSALLPFASEKVRLTIGEAFRQTPVTVVLPAVDASQPYQAPPPRPPSTPSALHPGATRILPTGEEPRMVKVRRPPSSRRTTEPVPRLTPPSLLSRGLTTGAILAGVVLVGTVLWVLLRKPALPTVQKTVLTAEPLPEEKSGPVPPALRRIDIATIPTSARISLDNGSPESGELHTTLPSDGESHVLRIWAQGYESRIISFGPDDRLPTQVHLDPVAKQAVVEQRPPIASPHKPAKTRHAAQAPDNSTGKEASDLKRGVNGALILE